MLQQQLLESEDYMSLHEAEPNLPDNDEGQPENVEAPGGV